MSAASSTPPPAQSQRRRAYWLKTLHEWHWVSSALCLAGLLLFAVTGFTLNHAGSIETRPVVTHATTTLAAPLREQLARLQPEVARLSKGKAGVPPELSDWLRREWKVDARGVEAEWSADEVYLSMPRPGGDAWVRIGLEDGEAEYESTDRGWISYFNDLHKGRHTGTAWRWFIDIFAGAALVFSITGLFILKMHAGNRPMTWPMTALGLLLPVLLMLLFIH